MNEATTYRDIDSGAQTAGLCIAGLRFLQLPYIEPPSVHYSIEASFTPSGDKRTDSDPIANHAHIPCPGFASAALSPHMSSESCDSRNESITQDSGATSTKNGTCSQANRRILRKSKGGQQSVVSTAASCPTLHIRLPPLKPIMGIRGIARRSSRPFCPHSCRV